MRCSCQAGGQWHANFRHLASYGGGFYSYLWARALSRRVWRRMFEFDPMSDVAGPNWCQHVLVHGGSRDPRRMMRELLADSSASLRRGHAKCGTQLVSDPCTVDAAEEALLDLVDLDLATDSTIESIQEHAASAYDGSG